MKLPKHIKEKIKEIVQLEREKLSVMQEITEWKPKLLGIESPVKALSEGWDWEMYFRGSPRVINEKEIEAVLLTALTGQIHKVDYGHKTITLSELRKQNEKK